MYNGSIINIAVIRILLKKEHIPKPDMLHLFHSPILTTAPAAYETLTAHFLDTGRVPTDYDLIVTGDLGKVGKEIVIDLFRRDGVDISGCYNDCGVMIFDHDTQDTHAGGSGCGCSAVVLAGHLMNRLRDRSLKRILFAGTGALLSPISAQQGESIPGICHAVAITSEGR